MHRWRMLFVGLCIFVFTVGCRGACQSHDDYTGPLPYEPSDFLFRKNSILGGDPAMSQRMAEGLSDTPTVPEEETADEESPTEDVPTPAPGLDLEDDLDGDLDRDLNREPMGEPSDETNDTTDADLDSGPEETAEDSDGETSSMGWKPASLSR